MRLPFLLIILALPLAFVAACGGEDDAVFLQDPEAALLQLGDVPGHFIELQGSRRHISNEESCAGAEGSQREECLSHLEQWGRLDGIEVEYRADDPAAFYAGVYDIFSAVSIYRDQKGAEDSFRDGLERLEKGLAETEDAIRVEIEPLADESAAFAVTTAQTEGDSEISVTLHVVDFRRGNTLARVGATAPTALASVDDAVDLARKLDQRILRVAGDIPPPLTATAAPATTTTPTTAESGTATATATATAPP